MQGEIWKAISDNRAYAVSNYGRVASAASKTCINVMSPSDNGKGYKIVKITSPKRKNLYVHRLVAKAFIPNPNGKSEVNHIDGNKSNNRADNLEWSTLQENRDHAKRQGLTLKGEETPAAKLTEDNVREIRRIFRDNPKENKTAVGKRFNVGCEAIIKIVNKERWKHVTD